MAIDRGRGDSPLATGTIAQDGVRIASFSYKWLRTSALCPAWTHRDLRVSHGHVLVEWDTILGPITDTEGGRPPCGRNLHLVTPTCTDLLLAKLHF